MDDHENTRSPSTTWVWKTRTIRVPAGGQKQEPPAGRHPKQLPSRDPRKPLTITISYRGGAECWWEIRGRGIVIRRPGALALHDVLSDLQGRLPKT